MLSDTAYILSSLRLLVALYRPAAIENGDKGISPFAFFSCKKASHKISLVLDEKV